MKRLDSDKPNANRPFSREGQPPPRAFDDTLDARVPAGRDPLELPSVWVVADRYEILGLLGSGGMGTVYRARDRELDEIVALKMLKKQIATTPGILERFRREVKLARRVTHRNVARTFDIGEHAGAKFLTMEFIPGQMLGALLLQRGRLRVSEVIRIGRDLCDGLGAAHAASVLHRDLKPANVIIAPDGRAVITDFGIARALSEGESARSVGGVVGTPAYMAPEQLQGVADLDARVDIYALGVMLFELLGGEVPWAAENPIQAALARLREPPPDIRTLRPSLTEDAAGIISKCLAMNRDERFASTTELVAALDQLIARESSPSMAPAASSEAPKSFVRATIAVLPIVNVGDRAQAYLAESLTEDLGDILDGVPEVRVRARQYAARSPDPNGATGSCQAIGKAYGVDAVVHGTLRADGGRVVVYLRLMTVEDGFPLWDGRFERPIAEIMAIADAAAAAIAEVLTTKTLGPPRSLPTNPVAHDLYLRGRHRLVRGWYDANGEAVRFLGEAHMLAPADAKFAAAYARALARSYGVDGRGEDAARTAKDTAEKALALDPRRHDARLALALVHLYRGEGVGAAAETRRAVTMAPNDPDVLEMLGRLRAEVGPLESAIANLEAALAAEPRFAEARYTMARAWALLGDRRRSQESLGPQPADPGELVPHLLTSARLAMWWRAPELLPNPGRALATLRPNERAIADLISDAATRRSLDHTDRTTLKTMFPSGAATTQRLASFHAQIRTEIYLSCDELEHALESLRDADANGIIDLQWLEHCPLLDAIRGHRDVDPIRRSTSIRAARVREILDAP